MYSWFVAAFRSAAEKLKQGDREARFRALFDSAVQLSGLIDPEGRVAYFVTCPWCVSIWVGAGWLAVAAAAPSLAVPLAAVLAWSSVTGLLSSME